jgi:hypothetical protein
MKLAVDYNQLIVKREKGEKGFYASRSAWGDAESAFLYNLKKTLNDSDCPICFDNHKDQRVIWIKKRMWKDGHMVDELAQYLRSKNPVAECKDGAKVYLCMYSDHWAIRGLDKDFNEGEATLVISKITICSPQLERGQHDRIAEQSQKNLDAIDKELGIPKDADANR